MSVAGRDHLRQKGFGPVDDAPEVDVDFPLDVFELGLLDVAVVVDAGVVVDLVDFSEVCDDDLGVCQCGPTLGDIEQVGFYRRAKRFGLADRFRQSLGVDVGEREFRPLFARSTAGAPADAGSSSGDGGDF